MTTAIQEPGSGPFQKPGEVCISCQPFWESQNLPVKRMVRLGKVTDQAGIEIVVCPHCDGETILRLNQ